MACHLFCAKPLHEPTVTYYYLHPSGTNSSEIWIKIQNFSFMEIYLKMVVILFWGGELTHWGRMPHICIGKLTIIGSDNGLSPGRRQAIIWTNAGILLIGRLETNFSEILIEIITFSFKKMRLKVSSAKWRPCCLSLNVLKMNEKSVMHAPCPLWPIYRVVDDRAMLTKLVVWCSSRNVVAVIPGI